MRNELSVLAAAKEGDKNAAEEIVRQNTPLVYNLCKRFFGRAENDDITAAGFEGLLKAVKGFDASRGYMFSTYAVPMIIGEIKAFLRDSAHLRAGGSAARLFPKIQNAERSAGARLGREPRLSEIAEEAGLSEELTYEALVISSGTARLDESEIKGVFDFERTSDNKIFVSELLKTLEKEDRRLIVLRYFSEKTQAETAVLMGRTQVWISRREKKILLELKRLTSGAKECYNNKEITWF